MIDWKCLCTFGLWHNIGFALPSERFTSTVYIYINQLLHTCFQITIIICNQFNLLGRSIHTNCLLVRNHPRKFYTTGNYFVSRVRRAETNWRRIPDFNQKNSLNKLLFLDLIREISHILQALRPINAGTCGFSEGFIVKGRNSILMLLNVSNTK